MTFITKAQAETMIIAAVEGDESDDVIAALDRARKYVASLPDTEAIPLVRAKWIYHEEDMAPVWWWECSACHKEAKEKTMYCPHCAAFTNMEEE